MNVSRVVCVAVMLVSSPALASGGVSCRKVDKSLPPVALSWGAGHVEGGGRISPYRLTLSGREVLINDPQDAPHVVQGKGGERAVAREVGYWNGGDRIAVWLADEQVSMPLLKLEAVRRDDVYVGTLTVSGVKGISLKDVGVSCTVE